MKKTVVTYRVRWRDDGTYLATQVSEAGDDEWCNLDMTETEARKWAALWAPGEVVVVKVTKRVRK